MPYCFQAPAAARHSPASIRRYGSVTFCGGSASGATRDCQKSSSPLIQGSLFPLDCSSPLLVSRMTVSRSPRYHADSARAARTRPSRWNSPVGSDNSSA
jgi:hypothetical protein